MTSQRSILFGGLALAIFAAHETVYALRGLPEHGLWTCNVALLAVAFGLLAPSPIVNAVGAFWLTAGLPLWIYYVATTADADPLAVVSHVGGLALGYTGIHRLGLPSSTWRLALLALAGLVLVSRFITAPADNINLSHGVWASSQGTFSSYGTYMLFFFAAFTGVFLALQRGLPKLGFRSSSRRLL